MRIFDSAILHIEAQAEMKVHIYLIQITLAIKHKHSDTLFYEHQREKWMEGVLSANWNVQTTFTKTSQKHKL